MICFLTEFENLNQQPKDNMQTTETVDEKPLQFKVTVKARMYHGVLYETMTRLGMNQTKMAEYLEVSQFLLGEMIRMKRIPNFTSKYGKKLKRKLEELTEMTVSEIFPDHVFTKEFLGQDKTIQVTKDIPIHLLENAGMVRQLTLPPDEELMQKEDERSHKNLEEALSTLTKRQKIVLHERFFSGKTLKKIACELGISSKRVDDIERKALRRLQNPMRMRLIQGEIRISDPLFQNWLREFDSKRPMAKFEK
jgi:RNA polymerase sigma factor (sigma-70 family)